MSTEGHSFDPTVLREYDIRGIVGKTLAEADARALGRTFGTILRRKGGTRISVGYDGRLTSPMLEAALVEGLTACGLSVLRIGRGPTPMLSWSTHTLVDGSGVMVTGSHNPPDHNGFKMTLGGKPFFGADIQALGRLAASGDFVEGKGAVETVDPREEYAARLSIDVPTDTFATLAWDPGHGATAEILNMVLQKATGHHHVINGVIDGNFPSHHPDPTVAANLVELQDCVRANGAVAGIAFDGDGDRIGVVDGEGQILWADQLMMLFAEDVLRTRPGETIIADVKSSQALFDEITRLGGKPLMWKTGHSLIKAKMAELRSPLAGEMSGHIFFNDRWYGFDDAIYAAIRLLGLLARRGTSLADLRRAMPALLNTPELRFPCSETRKFVVVEEVRARLAAAGADVTAIDGVRVNTRAGWWLLRASNTQDVLVARCEGRDAAGLAELKAALAGQLGESGIAAPADL